MDFVDLAAGCGAVLLVAGDRASGYRIGAVLLAAGFAAGGVVVAPGGFGAVLLVTAGKPVVVCCGPVPFAAGGTTPAGWPGAVLLVDLDNAPEG